LTTPNSLFFGKTMPPRDAGLFEFSASDCGCRSDARFGSRAVVDDVSFEVERSEIVALLGPSGRQDDDDADARGLIARRVVGRHRRCAIDTRHRDAPAQPHRISHEAPGVWDRLTVAKTCRLCWLVWARESERRHRSCARAVRAARSRLDARRRAVEGMRQKVALARALLHERASCC